MILVTRLNDTAFMINALYIEKIESLPDTKITLTNGHTYIVKETREQVERKIVDFYRSISLLGRDMGEENQHEK
ncbi:flagellar FlbD family protein [Heyndrickxia ginsengihumi]|uniref:flagellar FlbD family protein n=1 Tax=Heyndrickxia ginsengihumi TaxID=363870 RepID=UPI000471AE41|nr:flagellar FlbD family protein [Heyndrickxia ginsengihumi]MBE6182760.1 hypothetical protein [Bacillus sp. (in: firmicutes)]MCM3022500.1 flagellar FlbD family protein [Heyndrickxia ginsengihumi]